MTGEKGRSEVWEVCCVVVVVKTASVLWRSLASSAEVIGKRTLPLATTPRSFKGVKGHSRAIKVEKEIPRNRKMTQTRSTMMAYVGWGREGERPSQDDVSYYDGLCRVGEEGRQDDESHYER